MIICFSPGVSTATKCKAARSAGSCREQSRRLAHIAFDTSKCTSLSIFFVFQWKIEQSLFNRLGEGKLSPRIIFRTYSYEHPNRTAVIFWDNPDFAMPSINFSQKNPSLSMLILAGDPLRT
jgi:hypothetical protein